MNKWLFHQNGFTKQWRLSARVSCSLALGGPFLYLCGHILVSEIRECGRVQVTSKNRLMRLIAKHFHGLLKVPDYQMIPFEYVIFVLEYVKVLLINFHVFFHALHVFA